MTQSRTATSGATGGLRQTTWRNASLTVRLAGFAVAVTAVAFQIICIDASVWRQQARWQEEFAAIGADRPYWGVNFRVRLRRGSNILLDHHRSGVRSAVGESAHNAGTSAKPPIS